MGKVLFCRQVKTHRLVFLLNSLVPLSAFRMARNTIHPRKFADFLINVIIPLAMGVATYVESDNKVLPELVRNHLADACWAYAFASYLLIIWDREIRIVWMLAMVVCAMGFEILQSYHIVPGTGDLWDVLTYMLFFALCFLANPFFHSKYYEYKP